MIQLPEDFIRQTRAVMGDERFERYMEAFSEEVPTSIRLNPLKTAHGVRNDVLSARVPWCEEGYYLEGRPQFTFDPLFHAGCYYVQEAASMFVSHVLRHHVKEPVAMLDLCAAPGGKSTAAISALPAGSTLFSNEPSPLRAQILLENITKWGWEGCTVTNNYPRDYRKARACFDVILCDVPCSGEGMFRKDPQAVGEWSLQNVEKCWRLQREIVADAWECLVPGGLLIYSTCTFNMKENEENVRWIIEQYDAQVLSVPTDPAWQITGSLLEGFDEPVYRFIPGISRGEGLFLCALRKDTGNVKSERREVAAKSTSPFHPLQTSFLPSSTSRSKCDTPPQSAFQVELTYPQAIAYLRHEALVLPEDTPRGIGTVTFQGLPLGQVKNIGTRANNLYPKEWKIKTTHIPNDYEAILRHT